MGYFGGGFQEGSVCIYVRAAVFVNRVEMEVKGKVDAGKEDEEDKEGRTATQLLAPKRGVETCVS